MTVYFPDLDHRTRIRKAYVELIGFYAQTIKLRMHSQFMESPFWTFVILPVLKEFGANKALCEYYARKMPKKRYVQAYFSVGRILPSIEVNRALCAYYLKTSSKRGIIGRVMMLIREQKRLGRVPRTVYLGKEEVSQLHIHIRTLCMTGADMPDYIIKGKIPSRLHGLRVICTNADSHLAVV